MNDNILDSVDERRRQKFESDWLDSQAGAIDEYLPDPHDSLYLGTLDELVHIELEFLWKRFATTGKSEHQPPQIEAYLERFPPLGDSAVLSRLIQAEFELSRRCGQAPEISEYVSRFADKVSGDVDITRLLERVNRNFEESARKPEAGEKLGEGAELGRYRLVAEHGRGGYGAVWRADDTKLGRRIALKRLGSRLARNSQSRRRFVSEARVTAKLEHPGIVPVYDMSSLEEEHAYYTMKLVRGDTMAQAAEAAHAIPRNDRGRTVKMQNLLRSFLDVCHTIEYCHARGVLHRDLKPQNVVVGNYGETIVLDWGLASVSFEDSSAIDSQWTDDGVLNQQEAQETLKGSIKGTPAYMPPEQARGDLDGIGTHSDIYSLGAMLYHIIAGQAPFTDSNVFEVLENVKEGKFRHPREIEPTVTSGLQAICLKAMSLYPSDRYATVKDLSLDIEQHLADEPVSAYPEPITQRAIRWVRRHRTLASSAAIVFAFVIVAGIIGSIISSQARQKEIARIDDVREAAEKAETAGMLQIEANRFDSAAGFFAQAYELVADEPKLEALRDRIKPRRDRMRTIVDAYELADKAQEYLYFDQIKRTAVYSQAALQRIGAFDHADWWNYLPVEDLNPDQREFLQLEVYRLFGMLASMRVTELAPAAFSFQWILDLMNNPAKIQASETLDSATFAARAATRFRPSRLMEIVGEFGDVARGRGDSINLIVTEPANATDAAMMGSILDSSMPSDAMTRTALAVYLGGQDPQTATDAMLLEAVTNAPEWFWLPIFIGVQERKASYVEQDAEKRAVELEKSIRSFSHAVGVNPRSFAGYRERAKSYMETASQTKGKRLKGRYLKSAAQDIQMAIELRPNHPDLIQTYAELLARNNADVEPITDQYVESLLLRHRVADIREGHYANITQFNVDGVFAYLQSFSQDSETPFHANRLKAAAHLWKNEIDEAEQAIKTALEQDTSDTLAIALSATIALIRDPSNNAAQSQLESAVESGAAHWYTHRDLARALESSGQFQSAFERFQKAREAGRVEWQTAEAVMGMARSQLGLRNFEEARKLFDEAIRIDLYADFGSLLNSATVGGAQDVVSTINRYQKTISPHSDFSPRMNQIGRPAVMNADFEHGLSHGWSDSEEKSIRIWINHGDSESVAKLSEQEKHNGSASLLIQNSATPSSGAHGSMQQNFPVTPGVRYRISVWAKGEGVRSDAIGLSINPKTLDYAVSIPTGDYDWQQVAGEIVAESKSISLVVVCKDQAKAWLDELRIEAVD